MCGIAGFVDFGGNNISRRTLSAMLLPIKHRGPDDTGVYLDKRVGLGVQRLRIIDLLTGDQPIANEDGTAIVVYNGEIYNFETLRQELLVKGHQFKTKTDTEVLVHLYEEEGDRMAEKLSGMFAFALWDKRKQRLILCRDHAGIKPLYFFRKGNFFVFGSEIKALLAHPLIVKKINKPAIDAYLALGYLPGRESVFEGVFKLEPGTTLTVDRMGLKTHVYWKALGTTITNDQSLDDLLESTVNSQLISDVPLGVFLSGGIDSSLITYYLVKKKSRVNSFSVAFAEPELDESKYALMVAKYLGVKHHVSEFSAKDVIDLFPKITKIMDEPLADPSLFPTYKLCQFARKYVTVALSGDGGDEVFGGYPSVQARIFGDIFSRLPRSFDQMFLMFSVLAPYSFGQYSRGEVYDIFFKGLKFPPALRDLYWTSRIVGAYPESLLRSQKRSDWYIKINSTVDKSHLNSSWKSQLSLFLSYLPDDLLVKTDRAAMANSLEVRVPYLDEKIVNYAFRTGGHVDLFSTKKLLRKLAWDKLPSEIVRRKKKGFGIPLDKWLREELKELTADSLTSSSLDQFVPRKIINSSWEGFIAGKYNSSRFIWALVMLSGWLDNWGLR